MVMAAVVLVFSVLGAGVFFLWLHSLPERMVHNRLQYDLVAVLALLSLFTHVHAFWVAALLLTFITIPDFSRFDILNPLRSIAKSLRTLAGQTEQESAALRSDATSPNAVADSSSASDAASERGSTLDSKGGLHNA